MSKFQLVFETFDGDIDSVIVDALNADEAEKKLSGAGRPPGRLARIDCLDGENEAG